MADPLEQAATKFLHDAAESPAPGEPDAPHYSTNLAPYYIAEQIFFHVLLRGGEGNPFRAISSQWFAQLAAVKIRELLTPNAASQPPGDLSEVVRLLTELRTYYMQRDDPNGANWCEKVITEAKELEKL